MGKSKEEDKIENLIRGLLKLPDNRQCINCDSLGPQYVCTSFSTFVCTNCSGLHREFTHRVKSISMAKFSMEEVHDLQAGGNKKARQIYFKTWDPQRNFLPENSDIHKIRDFIKRVYVDRKYTGETRPASAQRSRNSGMHEPYEHKREVKGENSTFHEKTIDIYSRHSYDEASARSPPYLQENSRYGGSRAGCRFEGTDGLYQVDDTRIFGRIATQMFTTEDIKPRRRSPDRRLSSSDVKNPTVGHVKEILGENSHALRFANQPKFADRRYDKANMNAQQERDNYKGRSEDHDGPTHQRDASANAQSLDPQKHVALKSPVKKNSFHAHSKNTLEFLLFDLFTRAEMATNDQSGIPREGNDVSSPSTSNLSTRRQALAPSTSAAQAFTDEHTSSTAAPNTTSNTKSKGKPASDADTSKVSTPQMVPDLLSDDGVFTAEEIDRKQSPSTQHLGHFNAPFSDTCSTSVQTNILNEILSSQPISLSPASGALVTFSDLATQSSQPAVDPTRESQSLIGMQACSADTKASGRKELPASLFASPQLSSMTASGWPTSSTHGMGFNMGYYPQMQIPIVAKSSNPFDTNDNTGHPDINMHASMGFQQGGLSQPFIQSGISNATSFGSHLPGSTLTGSPSYLSRVHHQSPCAPTGSAHGAYMGQHFFHNKSPTSTQGTNGFGGNVGSTLLVHSNQQMPYRYPAPTDQSSFPPMSGGNPFG